MTWTVPTAKAALEAARAARRVDDAAPPLAENVTPLVTCGCGRQNTADVMIDIRALAPADRARLGLGGRGDFVCPACRGRAERTGELPRSDLARGLGAPNDHVAQLVARERAQRERLHPVPRQD